jgi:hypothetical protein
MKAINTVITLLLGLIFMSLFYSPAIAQEQKNDLQAILKDAKEIHSWDADDFLNIYNSDVVAYFKLSEYDTDLKKELFAKTPEYASKLKELAKRKEEAMQNTYFVTLSGSELSNYDTTRKGFKLELGSNIRIGGRGGMRPEESVEGIIFPTLPTELEKWSSFAGMPMPDGINIEYYFFPLSEEHGLEVENNKSDVQLYFIFKIADVKKVSYKTYSAGGEQGWFETTARHIIGNSPRVVVANSKSGAVYADIAYKEPEPKKEEIPVVPTQRENTSTQPVDSSTEMSTNYAALWWFIPVIVVIAVIIKRRSSHQHGKKQL